VARYNNKAASRCEPSPLPPGYFFFTVLKQFRLLFRQVILGPEASKPFLFWGGWWQSGEKHTRWSCDKYSYQDQLVDLTSYRIWRANNNIVMRPLKYSKPYKDIGRFKKAHNVLESCIDLISKDSCQTIYRQPRHPCVALWRTAPNIVCFDRSLLVCNRLNGGSGYYINPVISKIIAWLVRVRLHQPVL